MRSQTIRYGKCRMAESMMEYYRWYSVDMARAMKFTIRAGIRKVSK